MDEITYYQNDQPTVVFQLHRDNQVRTIGSDPKCTFILKDQPGIAPVHAEIRFANGYFQCYPRIRSAVGRENAPFPDGHWSVIQPNVRIWLRRDKAVGYLLLAADSPLETPVPTEPSQRRPTAQFSAVSAADRAAARAPAITPIETPVPTEPSRRRSTAQFSAISAADRAAARVPAIIPMPASGDSYAKENPASISTGTPFEAVPMSPTVTRPTFDANAPAEPSPSPAVESLRPSPAGVSAESEKAAAAAKQGSKTLQLAGYKLLEKIAAGETSVIFRAVQNSLERTVAIKILAARFENDFQAIVTFRTRAQIAAMMNHPNLIQIYDILYDNNKHFYSMELIEGASVATRLESDRFQVGESVKVMRQVISALEHIHSFQVVHRDLRPQNIIIRPDGVVKLMNLDLASMSNDMISREIKVSGTANYLAPEQVTRGGIIDERTDIYSVGAVFYHMLTGRPPISGKSLVEAVKRIAVEEPTPIDEIDYTIPEDLVKIVHRMIRKDPDKRYKRAKDVLFALKKILL